jgi:hypothetical protein
LALSDIYFKTISLDRGCRGSKLKIYIALHYEMGP